MQPRSAVHAEALYGALRGSLSAAAPERAQAEAELAAAGRAPGFLAALLQVAAEVRAEPEVRQASAILLKNQVKTRWEPVGEAAGEGYGEDEKAAVRGQLLDGLAGSFEASGARAQLVEAFGLVALHDFPQRWPGLVERLVTGLRSQDTPQTYCALLLLRKLFKQLEMRPLSRRGDLDELAARSMPTLLALAPALLSAAARPGLQRLEAFEVLKVALKCVHSAVYMAVNEGLQKDIDAWMQIVFGAVELPALLQGQPTSADDASLESSPVAKCRKWAFHILFRFMHRHGSRRRCVNGFEQFAEAWSCRYESPTAQVCMREACASQGGGWVPRRSQSLALLNLADACSRDGAYEAIRPRLQELLVAGIFPLLRFGPRDARLWREDPEELLRQMSSDFAADSMQDPRVAATELVERLLRHRKSEVLVPLLLFCHQRLEAQRSRPTDPELCADKDGALLLLGCMGEQLLELDPAQAGQKRKKKKKKAAAREGDAGVAPVSVAELLDNHVRPELSGPVPFLRLRACWVYSQLARRARLGPPGAAAATCRECLRLAGDPELPVRARVGGCLMAFLEREGDGEVRAAIAESLGELLERLLLTLAEAPCEEIAEGLEALVCSFPAEIVPFAAQLVSQLAANFYQVMGSAGEDDDEAGAAAMGSMQTMGSVLQACSGLGAGGDCADAQRREALFGGMAAPLAPLLARLLRPEGVDFLEEACEILSYLVLYGPSPLPAPLWGLLPQLFQAVCGHPTPSLPLAQAFEGGWAVDLASSMLRPLECYMARGPPELFVAGRWEEAGMSYPQMVLGIAEKCLGMSGVGSEGECAVGARLAAAAFGNAPAAALDALLPRTLEQLWRRLLKAETAELRRSCLVAFGTMLWHSAELFVRCAEQAQLAPRLFEAWMQHVCLLRRARDRRAGVLGLSRLLQLGLAGQLPAVLAPGLPHLARQLAAQSAEVARKRARRAAGTEETDSEEDEDAGADGCSSGEDDDDFDWDDACGDDGAGFGGGVLPDCPSALDAVDELHTLRQVLHQAPPPARGQLEAWLGPAELQRWLADLDAGVAAWVAASARP